jgi:hypothetical protein
MPTVHNVNVPNSSESPNQLQYANGFDDLAAGTCAVSIPGFPGTAHVSVQYAAAGFTGANAGFLQPSYNAATGTLTVTSSNVADDNTFAWAIWG